MRRAGGIEPGGEGGEALEGARDAFYIEVLTGPQQALELAIAADGPDPGVVRGGDAEGVIGGEQKANAVLNKLPVAKRSSPNAKIAAGKKPGSKT